MSLRTLILAVCIGSNLFYFSIQMLPQKFPDLKSSATQIQSKNCANCNNFCTIKELKSLAKSITVKIISENGWGSGIILKREKKVYTIVTNQHVLDTNYKSYLIQTPDGLFYEANQIENEGFQGNDLALLKFRSTNSNYTVASLENSATLSPGDKTFAAGFSALEKTQYIELLFTRGKISILSDRPLEKGYQIGYTNLIKKGMSGGPLLNIYGQVVGINGMHAYPLWGDPYVYRDGSQPTESLRQQMSHLAFAIPIETVAKLAPNLHLYKLLSSRKFLLARKRQK
ncbi:MAG: serine protease [Trichodesmium sp. St2_bin6]|nr:serine protease [Trichodesmium sp. MAG_R01]MDE5074260.1 serine protease [Trichodesmium sp. St5_bin8]MDE5077276.1 serine protease [Trichodesmium sp. St2_bin6]